MKGLQRLVLGTLSLAFIMVLELPLSAATYKITWLLGHKNLDYFEEAAQAFKNTVEKESNGDILIDIRAQLPDERSSTPFEKPEIAEKVARGEAEMGHSFTDVMGSLDPRMHLFEAPYLFRGYRHMEGVFEGPLGSELLDGLRAHGVVGLSFTYSGGASGVATVDREIRGPEDLKGLKVGVYGDAVNEAWLSELGAKAVPIGHVLESIAPLAREQKLDAVVTTWRNFDRENLGAEFRRVGLMGSTYLVSVTYINPKFFDSLPKKYQALLSRASREAGGIERARTIQLNEGAKRGMIQDRGILETYLTQENQRRFEKALRPAYARSIERVLGKTLIERVRKTGDAPQFPAIPDEFAKR